jgi:hypothetical protein
MQIEFLLDKLPLWLFFVITASIVLISIVSGSRLGCHLRQCKKNDEGPIGSIVGAMLGLLAFILAFTFGMTASRFDTRKQLLLDEVNAIGTAVLRSDFLPEPQRTETRKLFKEYVDIRSFRSEEVLQPEKLQKALADSEALHDQLWSQVVSLSRESGNPVILGLYIQSLNDVIDFHSKRVTVGLQYRIPGAIWLALYFMTILAMGAVGYHFVIAGADSFLISIMLSLAFSSVILLIADLDRPSGGFLRVSQKPMLELQQKMSISIN